MFRFIMRLPRAGAAGAVVALVALVTSATLSSHDTPIAEKIRRDDLGGLRAQLAAGANLEAGDATGATPLMQAAAIGSLDAMRLLVEAGANVNASAADGTTPLMWATADTAKVRLLLEHGAAVNAVAKDGTTALVAAAQRGEAGAVRLLLAHRADARASGDEGAALFQAAFSTSSHEVRHVLAQAGLTASHFGQVAPAISRVDYVDRDLIARYLSLGGDPNLMIPMVTVKVPLVAYAAMVTDAESVGLLLDRGADPNMASTRGATALMMAAAADNADPAIVRLLLARGARADARDADGRSALDWALMQGDTAVAGLLREAGAPVSPSSAAPAASKASVPPLTSPLPLRTAVEKAIGSMDGIGEKFYDRMHCVSCHNNSLPAMARQLAMSGGVRVEPAVASHADRVTLDTWAPHRNAYMVGRCGGGGYIPTVTYALVSMADEKRPADETTDGQVVCLASRQSADGSWRVNDQRPPLSGSPIVYTALAIRALDAYAPPALRPEMARRIDRARAYLESATPHGTQEEAFTLMGLAWSHADERAVAAQAARVAALQRTDGGWSQMPLMASDAYATGQALFALRLAGTAPADARYASGVSFLLRTQRQDGSWFVQSRGFGFQPFFEYGFAHGTSQFISAAATSWAVMAIAPAM